MRVILLFAGLGLWNTGVVSGQPPVDRGKLYQRIHAVVPLIGKGTYEDPRRPMYAPAPDAPIDKGGIRSYVFQESDDGRFAPLEFVVLGRGAFRRFLTDSKPKVTDFQTEPEGLSAGDQVRISTKTDSGTRSSI